MARGRSAQKLLDWLQHDWTGPTITARDIYHFGPNSTRESAIDSAEILVKNGWLVPSDAPGFGLEIPEEWIEPFFGGPDQAAVGFAGIYR